MFVGSRRRPFVKPQLCIFAAIIEAPGAARKTAKEAADFNRRASLVLGRGRV